MEKYQPKQLEFCTSEDCEVEEMCTECIVNQFKYTDEGVKLASMEPRFSHFHWEDLNRFQHYYGSDVHPFYHGPHQAKSVAIPFIEAQNTSSYRPFSKEDAKALYLTHVTHDFHEGLVGDIPLPEKQARGESWAEYELQENLRIVGNLLGLSGAHPHIQKLREVQSGDTFLSRAFTAGEYVGYMNTGMRAWAMKDWQLLHPAERQKCHDLGSAVLVKNTPTLEKYAAEFIYVDDYLKQNWWAITEARHES